MKKLLLLTASFVFTAISAFAAEAKIALTISQKSPIPIVIPAKVAEADRYAARELRDYIGKITGAKVRILNEKRAPKGAAIYVGDTEFAKKAKIRFLPLCRLASASAPSSFPPRAHSLHPPHRRQAPRQRLRSRRRRHPSRSHR